MMVETILECSQDFGMSNGALPQWKRELLQRRAARSRPAQPPPQPPPPPPTHDEDDEELRYGPGIVKRLKSRYLSLALRDAPRRRPSVLRRAASLEHLLDERPPPAPAPRSHPRPPRPASVAAPPAVLQTATRRDSVKRARSVDALSRLDSRDEPRAPSPSPPPPLAPRPPPQPRTARPPRRPTPLLRETERPPPDVVRSTLRKFESAPTRRAAPAARVSAVLRGLECPRTSTPEPRESSEAPPLSPRTPSPQPPIEPLSPVPNAPSTSDEAESTPERGGAGPRPVSRAALEGIARAGSTVRYAFEAPRAASHLPPLSATNQVLVGRARRVGVIRPMPARATDATTEEPTEEIDEKTPDSTARLVSPSPPPPTESEQAPPGRTERREPPPAALVEPIPRPPPDVVRPPPPPAPIPVERSPSPESKIKSKSETITTPLVNGHTPEVKSIVSRIGAAGIERAWSGSGEKKPAEAACGATCGAAWARGAGSPQARRGRAPAPASTSVVFNFSNRKEVPDYIENDGIILRASRRNRIKAGEPGVVVLRPEALQQARSDSDSESELDGAPPSPCAVRFVNDNVLINGRSSMPNRPNKDRIAKLKLQFDDSLTRTFEYPSETSLCEESPTTAAGPPPPGPAGPPSCPTGPPSCPAGPPSCPAVSPQLAESVLHAPLAANTHISSAALSRYTPHKTVAGSFQLGVTRHDDAEHNSLGAVSEKRGGSPTDAEPGDEREHENEHEREHEHEHDGDARPCGADVARAWSDARALATDLLF